MKAKKIIDSDDEEEENKFNIEEEIKEDGTKEKDTTAAAEKL